MKKNILQFAVTLTLVTFSLLTVSLELLAQQTPVLRRDLITEDFNELATREAMKSDGLSAPVIDKLIMERKLMILKNRTSHAHNDRGGNNPLPLNCSDIGVETGWGSWKGTEGATGLGGVVWYPTTTTSNPAPTRFNITTGTGIDPCTPGTAPGAPPIPVVAPGFGNSSIQIGERKAAGCMAEQLTYSFLVTPQDTNFVYAYAVVFFDPIGNHTPLQKPYVDFVILKANGDTVACSYQHYISDVTATGFYQTNNTCMETIYAPSQGIPAQGFPDTYYKPWTTMGVSLKQYLGQNLTVVITNVDCQKCAHFAHSYWDFQCGPLSIPIAGCVGGQPVTITGPASDPNNPFTYQWSQNGAVIAGATSQSVIITSPGIGDTVTVKVSQQSGCSFYLTYVLQAGGVTPNFNFSGKCNGVFNFSDSSFATPSGSIASWNWQFPGGTPSTATSPTVSVTYPPGVYTVTLTVTSSAGCVSTIVKTVTVGGIPPVAAFNVSPFCVGGSIPLLDGSAAVPGDPIVGWNWTMAGGTPASSTSQNTSTLFNTPGTHSVTLIVTSQQGCKDTIVQPLQVLPPPIANFSGAGQGCFSSCVPYADQSTSSAGGTITSWTWNFPSGTPSSSAVQNPGSVCYSAPGTYTATLIVVSSNGCTDTLVQPVTVGGLPPVAAFSSLSPCLGSNTSLTDGSLFSQGDSIVSWNWTMPGGSPSNSTSQNPNTTYNTAGSHTVTLVITSKSGCKDTIDQQVLVYNSPVVNFSIPAQGCAPVCTSFSDLSTSADGSIIGWNWSFPGGSSTTSTLQNPQNICYNTPGTYSVSLTVTSSYGCSTTLSLPMIEVYPWPTAGFCVAPAIAPATDPVFNFCDQWSSDVMQWSWDFGDGDTDIVNTDPVHSYSATANANDFYSYNVCIRVQNQYGCWDSTCKTVELVPEFTFYIPNTFTPNGDLMNEMFFGKSRGVKEYSIWLFDRWGNQVWDCHHEGNNTDWDGSGQEGLSSFCQWDGAVVSGGLDMNGNSRELAQQDVYVWKVKLTDIFDRKHDYLGHVNIVR